MSEDFTTFSFLIDFLLSQKLITEQEALLAKKKLYSTHFTNHTAEVTMTSAT